MKTFYIETPTIKSIFGDNPDELRIEGYANTVDKDRVGDVVRASAWAKGVDNFKNNPILLYQHDHDKPIGKVTNLTIDSKGLHIEAVISEVAEKQYGVKTLIKEGILRSFSVGFSPKDAEYDKVSDTFAIKELDLLEISVVSVPCNQYSLFSVKKSFEKESEYEEFKKQFVSEILSDEEKVSIIAKFQKEITATVEELEKLQDSEILDTTKKLVSLGYTNWEDSQYLEAKNHLLKIESLKSEEPSPERDSLLIVYGHNTNTLEEKDKMSNENNQEPLANVTNNAAAVETKGVNNVAEPEVAKLIQKTGEALLKADEASYRAEELKKAVDFRALEEVAELKAQLKAMQEQANAYTTSKMTYQENSRNTQFTEVDKANAVIVAKALNRGLFDTKLGERMKAILTDTHLQESFSTNIYEEMRQQLVIAPMFTKVAVNSKEFRIPVADEDTSDYVAQFPSGSFSPGVKDSVTVPTSRQAQIGSVTLAPGKFMVATHIAKDEQEDTIIQLVDFQRQAAARRLARAMDTAILRGDGTLSAFSANNTLTPAGAYPSIIKGLVELAAGVPGLITKTGSTTDKADPADIASARMKLGRYGLSLGNNLAYITSIEGYNSLVTSQDFLTVDKFGSQATYLTGSVGAIYGIPIFVSEFMDQATATNANLGILVYKPGFVVGERRAVELESEYLPQQQATAMYFSTRFDFKALTTVTNAALSTRYSLASLITTA